MALTLRNRASLSFFWSVMALTCSVLVAMAQRESYTATASMQTAAGTKVTSPVSIAIDSFSSASDREALLAAIKKGGTAAAREWLAGRPGAGTLQVGARKSEIKYAYKTPAGSGSLITIGTAEPLYLVGAGVPGATKAKGFDLTLLLLQVPATGSGTGELSPAAKLRIDEKGAIVTEDFNAAEMVRLTDVVRK
jgi:hypothetical protein